MLQLSSTMYRCLLIILSSLLPIILFAQQGITKKTLSHKELTTWNRIEKPQISNDGNWVVYELRAEEGDPSIHIYDAQRDKTIDFIRADEASISADNQFVIFKIKPPQDSVKNMRRRKVRKESLPKEHLGIYEVASGQIDTIKNVKNYQLPEKWSGWLAYHLEAETQEEEKEEAKRILKNKKRKKRKKPKKESEKNGSKLGWLNLVTKEKQLYPFVLNYQVAEEGKKLSFISSGNDSTFAEGVYLVNTNNFTPQVIWQQKGEYQNLAFDKKGNQLAFQANFDTTKALIPPFELLYWKNGQAKAKAIANQNTPFLPKDWIISPHNSPKFSENGHHLFWTIAPKPMLQDTSLLEEEIVNVEVWHWEDAKLHTQQNVLKEKEAKKSFTVVWHPKTNEFIQIGDLDRPNTQWADEGNGNYSLAYSDEPYYKNISWEGFPSARDVYVINHQTGQKKEVGKNLKGDFKLSPKGKYVYAWITPDSAWFAYHIATGKMVQITNNDNHPFYDEWNDRPMHPNSVGIAGWTEEDQHALIYDRYDIWRIDPNGQQTPVRLTKGREKKQVYRYLQLDKDDKFIDTQEKLLLRVFDETTKESGYAWLDYKTGALTEYPLSQYQYGRDPIKAKNANRIVFTKENFQTFPDLLYSDLTFSNPKKISSANPQQNKFKWGTIELYKWISLDGQPLEGLLVKPENFNPNKKYPLLVNFYERNSDGLYRHRAPYPHRSTMNYSFYTSRGYIIFNPDIPYKVGYPGESCYNSVISGVTALLQEGFIDKERIGVQGHSWGGYQIAYLLTKTDIFKCAESGAPVVNMFSAYGGIRWGSGLSRMFQYERTQSRIGGTIWEYPLRYIENSPIFEMDKTNTPVLILHNDNDGAVPWYQGIEYFVALRRLGKPAWLLNYNDEPHWPLKLQNRKDFNIRMQQFFDHYLLDEPMPKWMQSGVPALQKGILQGLELVEEEK